MPRPLTAWTFLGGNRWRLTDWWMNCEIGERPEDKKLIVDGAQGCRMGL